MYLWDKHLVATRAVLDEFRTRIIPNAGKREKILAGLFLLRVDEIPNDPSARVLNLRADSKAQIKKVGAAPPAPPSVDRIAFGTGDKLRITTATGDAKFVIEAAKQGVVFTPLPWVHPFAQYAGK
jgi:Protein of unknown function (DUF1308)